MDREDLQAFFMEEGKAMEKITKEISGGESVYRDEKGEILTTYSESLEDILNTTLVPLRDFLKMQSDVEDDDDLIRAAYIALALLERVEGKIDAAADYIDKNYGRVEIERVRHRQSVTPETMLGVVFRPCRGVTA